MTRLRNISANELIKRLKKFGYEFSRQKGSHIRLTTKQRGAHHVSVPQHDPLNIGTLSGIIHDVAVHFGLSKEDVIERLFGE